MMKRLLIFLWVVCCVTALQGKTRKALYIVLDGIPADYIERVHPKNIFAEFNLQMQQNSD